MDARPREITSITLISFPSKLHIKMTNRNDKTDFHILASQSSMSAGFSLSLCSFSFQFYVIFLLNLHHGTDRPKKSYHSSMSLSGILCSGETNRLITKLAIHSPNMTLVHLLAS